jgi:hypothetical protein
MNAEVFQEGPKSCVAENMFNRADQSKRQPCDGNHKQSPSADPRVVEPDPPDLARWSCLRTAIKDTGRHEVAGAHGWPNSATILEQTKKRLQPRKNTASGQGFIRIGLRYAGGYLALS